MERFYKLAVYADMLDTNPTIETFSTEWEAQDAASEAINAAVQWRVDHSPYSISEKELEEMRQEESLLVKIFHGIIKKQTNGEKEELEK